MTLPRRSLLALSVVLSLLAPPATAWAGPFSQGRTRLSLWGGGSFSPGGRSFAIGGGVGWFAMDGLELGAEGAVFPVEEPFVAVLGPQVRYVVEVSDRLAPYAGVFHRHWFIAADREDQDAIGARGGVLLATGAVFLQLGLAYERLVRRCQVDCTRVVPEIGLSLVL